MITFYPDDPNVRLLARGIERQESKTRSKAVFHMALGVFLIILCASFLLTSVGRELGLPRLRLCLPRSRLHGLWVWQWNSSALSQF